MAYLREITFGLVLVWIVLEALGKGRRALPAAGAVMLFALLTARGLAIDFFPLTNKYESFLAFSTAVLAVAAMRHGQSGRPGRILLALVAAGFIGATFMFDHKVTYAPPLMYTIWYPIHVPLSFFAYAFWAAAAGDGLDHLLGSSGSIDFGARQEANVLMGFTLFSVSMIFGAVWGIVSWGAYFIWDAKILWSLVAWLYFSSFAHLRYWPVKAGGLRAGLGLLGLVVMLITYVGTSFMSGSIHSF